MSLYHYPITREPLSTYVDSVWVFDGYTQPCGKEKVLPAGTIDIVFTLDGRNTDYAGIAGVQSAPVVIPSPEKISLVAIHFRPGRAFAFLNQPADELLDVIVSLDTVCGGEAARCHEQLLAASGPAARFRLVEQFLLHRFNRQLPHPAVSHALQIFQLRGSLKSVAEVSEQSDLSHKKFIDLFRREVGITPKSFQRIVRFNQVLDLLNRGSDLLPGNVTSLAAASYRGRRETLYSYANPESLTDIPSSAVISTRRISITISSILRG